MANLFDYLRWRSDVPLSVDPFNEVDNLVLAELAYTDFRGIVPEDGSAVSLPEAWRAFFGRHTREEIAAASSVNAKAPLLMDRMVDEARFRDTWLCLYTDHSDPVLGVQMAAVTFLLPDGSAYAAFRGTDGTLVGWKEDFNFSFLSGTEGQARAVEYLNRAGARIPGPLRVGGHSKGGNFAMYASAFCDPAVQDRISEVWSNDGPGFRQEILQAPGYERILPKIISIVPDTSVIGLLLNSGAKHRVIRSSASGIQQHDSFSWEVNRSRFEAASLSRISLLVERTLSGWLEEMDDDARRSFVDTIFVLFESTGKNTFSSISRDWLKSAETILSAALVLPKEKQLEVLQLLKLLGRKGGQTVADFLAARIGELRK